MQDGETVKSVSGLMLGRYRLLRRIGKGGMGEVWLGEDARLHRQVAIKTLPTHNQGDREYLQRFEREARAAAALNHPHILPVHDYGEQVLPDGQAITYIVMPYISGGTLNEHIKTLTENGSIMPPREAINYLSQAAQAIDYAHEQNVLHRDIKPSNMLLRSDDWLLLADFGIARLTSDKENLTQAGVGIGTPEYMAPEQAQGKAVAASDNYSLAVIAYQLFTGQLPFKAETPYATTVQHIVTPPPPPREVNPDISPAVERAILHGLAKEPEERPPSAQAFVAELQHALEGKPYEVSDAPTLLLAGGPEATEIIQPEMPRPESLVPGQSKLRVPPPAQGITRRRVLIGGGAVLLAAAGLGTWAVVSREHSTAPVTTTHKATPTVNPGAPTFTLLAHTQPITSLAWSPTAPNILASAGQDSQVMLWDMAAIEQGQANQTTPKAKQVLGSTTPNVIVLAWSADGQALAIGNAVFTVESNGKLVDMVMLILKNDLSGLVPYFDQQYMTFRRTGFIRTAIWGPGKYLTAITFPAELAGKTTYYLELRDPLHPNNGFGTAIEDGFGFSLALPPDASKLAMGTFSGITVGVPVVSGSKVSWKTPPTLLTFDGTKPLTNDGSKPPAADVTWSPDGRYVAGITNPLFVPKYIRSQLAVWNPQQGDSSRTSLSLPRADAILTKLAWSPAPTSTQLAAGSKDGSVYLWNVNPDNFRGNALPVRTLTGPAAEVTALAWSPDGRYLAAGYKDTNDSILIWKL
jgi:eukaryotic-like serine/threonine-protein kinase